MVSVARFQPGGATGLPKKRIAGQAISPPVGSTGPAQAGQPFLGGQRPSPLSGGTIGGTRTDPTFTPAGQPQPFPSPRPQIDGDKFGPPQLTPDPGAAPPVARQLGPEAIMTDPVPQGPRIGGPDILIPPGGPGRVGPGSEVGAGPSFPGRPGPQPFTPDPRAGQIDERFNRGPVGLENLAGRIEEMLGQPTAFEGALPAVRKAAETNLREKVETDAQRRGLTFSTIPSGGIARGLVDIEGNLQSRLASARDQQLNQAIQFGQNFGQAGQQGSQFQQLLAMQAAGLGGNVDIASILRSIGGVQ